jgi:hypothetical protein
VYIDSTSKRAVAILGVMLAGCGLPEPTLTPIPQPPPSAVVSPAEAPVAASPTGPAPDEITPPDAIHNADLLANACSYPFDEVIEQLWGRRLRRGEVGLVGYAHRSACNLRTGTGKAGTDNVGNVHVYKPLSERVVRRRFAELVGARGFRVNLAGTPVYLTDLRGYHTDDIYLLVAHPSQAVLIILDRRAWEDDEAAMRDVADGVVAILNH